MEGARDGDTAINGYGVTVLLVQWILICLKKGCSIMNTVLNSSYSLNVLIWIHNSLWIVVLLQILDHLQLNWVLRVVDEVLLLESQSMLG